MTRLSSTPSNNSPGQGTRALPRSAAVEMINGRPMIVINGKPHYPMIHSLTDVPSGRWSWEELPQHNIRNFSRSGISLFQLDLFLEHVWPAEDVFDLTLARKQIAGVLEVCPEAGVIFRFHLRAPTWWLHQHPEEWVAYADTGYAEEQQYGLLRIIEHDNNPVRRVSMASRKWRRAVTEQFARFLNELAATPEGNALVGIQVANGVYGEWHNWGFFENEPDISEPMTAAFRDWLRDKYGTDTALRTAWNNREASFENVKAPGMDKRATSGIFRDLETEREIIDFFACMHQTVADNIIHFAETLKANWPRPIIAGTFYGYFFSTFGRQAPGGHLQLQRILEAEAIDYLSGPQAYEPEAVKLGDPYRSRSLITSVRLHQKLWLDEMDVEPKIPLLKDPDYEQRLQESVADVRRNVSFTYTKGMGLWFYDFNISGVDLDGYIHLMSGSQGNWDHPVVMRQIEEMLRLFHDKALAEPYRSEADVLLVYDTDSFYYTASLRHSDPVNTTLIDYNTLAAFRSGVVFDTVHLDDLDRVDLSAYRVIIFGNTGLLNDDERGFIRERVAAAGRHLVWFHAPGFIDETRGRAGQALIEALTGFQLKPLELDQAPEIILNPAMGVDNRYTVHDRPFHPVFAVADPLATTWGTFPATGQTAIAHKVFDTHTAWFVSLPSKTLQPLQFILQSAGAHVYGEGDAVFYAGGGILVMHTLLGGRQFLHLRNGRKIQVDLPEGPSTVLINSQTGDILMNTYSPETEKIIIHY